MALDYDFFLTSGATSLGFNKKITAETPEERATAQFRKEQFDSQQTVGDQSLSGWWTRGQLSFHRGAGVKYYEVLDGEEVLNRFQSSTGIYPWEPGEVVLSGALSTVTLDGVEDAVSATYSGTPGVLAKVGTVLRFVTSTVGATVASWQPTRSILSITTSGDTVYFNTAQSIEKPAATTITFTNHWTNPRFYSTGTAVTGYGVTPPTFTYNNGFLTFTSAATDPSGYSVALTGLTIDTEYRVLLNHQASAGSVTVRLDDGAAGTIIASGTADPLEGTFTATATSHSVFVVADGLATDYSIREFSVTDDLHSPTVNPVDDPDNWSWSSTAHASKSTRVLAAGTDYTDMWFPPSGRTWARLWWAKGRIFAIDNLGKWYTLSTAGGTATDSQVFWSPNLGTTGWSVAESPGAVYIARGTDVYMVTPDSDGFIPTITSPVVAASLPSGETISTIYAYLGRMVICTNQGLRVAHIDPSSGDLFYGARIVDGDFGSCVRVTALEELAYVVGTPDDASTPSLYSINMADNDDLEPSWAEVRTVATGTLFGATATPDGRVMSWGGTGFYRSTTGYVSSGQMLTGLHRLGTLEPKAFQYLRVITGGTVGSVSVDVVLPDGTSTSVGSVSAGNSAEISLAAAVPTPVEYIALRFTLTGDTTDTPILLGYQLKALPVPKRQRMKRVPLMLFDREQNRVGQEMGNDGSAWTRLQALEALEEANAVANFEDKETGETGSAYIESVEMRRTAPTSRHGDGFGGTIWLTLRVI